MRKKYRIWIIGLVVASLTLGLSGCGEKGPTLEEVQAENDSLYEEIDEKDAKIRTLEEKIAILNGDETSDVGIGDLDSDTGNSLRNVGGRIIFNSPLEYKGAVPAPNQAGIQIASKITVDPSNNWITQFDGTTVKFTHPTGIEGRIKASYISEQYKGDAVKTEMLEPFLNNIPNTGIKESLIYLDDVCRGAMANVKTTFEGKPCNVVVGLFGKGEYAITFCFYYEGDKDVSKDEVISSLIKTISVRDVQVQIEY